LNAFLGDERSALDSLTKEGAMSNLRGGISKWAVASITAAILGAAATPVLAQCSFERPTRNSASPTGRYIASLVQAHVNCGFGGNVANTVSQGGHAACAPPQTFVEQAGNPPNGWRFSTVPNTSWGRVRLDRQTGAFTNPTGIRDTRIRLWLRDIVDATGFADGNGVIQLVLRPTVNDPVNADMTLADITVQVLITLNDGDANVNVTLDDILIPIDTARLPDCTSLEVVSIAILDENGQVFAVPGVRVN
jgi:hypothetical protein